MQKRILKDFRKIVTPEFISKTACKYKFSQRSTQQISSFDFVRMLIHHAGSGLIMSYSGLNATLNKINPNLNISNQALAKYFYKQATVDLIRTVYEKIFSFQKERLLQQINHQFLPVLSIFNRILLQDSTTCVLNSKLKDQYPGSGGSASPSSLKIDVIHEIKTGAVLKINIFHGKKPDITESNSILDDTLKGDLILRDLGYCKLESLARIIEKLAYFISRYHPSMNVYLENDDSVPLDLGSFLKHKCNHLAVIERDVYLGNAKQKCRLIAYRVPPEVSNERRRKAKRTIACRKKGGTASQAYLVLFDFVILITNVPSELLEASIIGTIYRLRWSIELVFKTWKSLFKLQLNLTGSKAIRIECFVYTILILALLTMIVQGWMRKMELGKIGEEISLDKLSKWLLNNQGYVKLLWHSISNLESSLHRDLRKIKSQKRKIKTTLERVVLSEDYSKKYIANI